MSTGGPAKSFTWHTAGVPRWKCVRAEIARVETAHTQLTFFGAFCFPPIANSSPPGSVPYALVIIASRFRDTLVWLCRVSLGVLPFGRPRPVSLPIGRANTTADTHPGKTTLRRNDDNATVRRTGQLRFSAPEIAGSHARQQVRRLSFPHRTSTRILRAVNEVLTLTRSPGAVVPERLLDLQHEIEHSAHLLPTQSPIRVFVHHNTLHAFEDSTFSDAVSKARHTYGCQPICPRTAIAKNLPAGASCRMTWRPC